MKKLNGAEEVRNKEERSVSAEAGEKREAQSMLVVFEKRRGKLMGGTQYQLTFSARVGRHVCIE